jgi:hypothetical protein
MIPFLPVSPQLVPWNRQYRPKGFHLEVWSFVAEMRRQNFERMPM